MSIDKNSRFLPSKMLREATRKQAYGVYFGLDSGFNFGRPFLNVKQDQQYEDSDLCACALGVLYEGGYGKPFYFDEHYLRLKIGELYPYLFEDKVSEEDVFDKVKDFLTDIQLVELVDNVFLGDYIFNLEERTLLNNMDGINGVTLAGLIIRCNDKAKFSFNTIANILQAIGY